MCVACGGLRRSAVKKLAQRIKQVRGRPGLFAEGLLLWARDDADAELSEAERARAAEERDYKIDASVFRLCEVLETVAGYIKAQTQQ